MTAIITGASKGIGRECAELLLKNGYEVICLSRTPCPISGVSSILCDITDEENLKAAFAGIEQADVLINNAGFGISGAVVFTSQDEIKKQFELNFFAQIAVIKAALPLLRKSGGRIVNISSAAALFSIPFQSFYSATKAAVESLTAALRNELKPFGITVCALRLGDVKTEFTASRQKNFDGDDLYGGMISRSVAVMEADERGGMSPATVARAMLKTIRKKRPPLFTTVGAKYKFFCFLDRILPSGAVNKLVELIYMPKR